MIDWKKYDPDNPPEIGKRFLINVHKDLEFTFSAIYEEWGWNTGCNHLVEGSSQFIYYTEINLPV